MLTLRIPEPLKVKAEALANQRAVQVDALLLDILEDSVEQETALEAQLASGEPLSVAQMRLLSRSRARHLSGVPRQALVARFRVLGEEMRQEAIVRQTTVGDEPPASSQDTL